MPRSRKPTQTALKTNERKNSDVEWKGYANVPLPEDIEEQFVKASSDDVLNLLTVAADFGFKVSVEPVAEGFKCTFYGVRTDGGFADGVAVTGGGASAVISLFVVGMKMQMCEWSPESFLAVKSTDRKRFW